MDFLRDYLEPELELVRHHLDLAFQVEGHLMQEVATYVGALRGKLIRPSMLCLFARAAGGTVDDRVARLAASVELFHLATLLHDDVIDNSDTRRGKPTVNAKWGNDVAILFADYLYATSFDFALTTLDPEVMRVMTRTTQQMAEGEMFQIERRSHWLSVEDYTRIVRAKTGVLFGAATGLGVLVGGGSGEKVKTAIGFGIDFGIAFQITDDALDYEAQGDKWGKRVGGDVAEGKQTLPLLHTLAVASEEDRVALLNSLNNGRDFELIHTLVRRYKGIDAALEAAAGYSRRAQESLDRLGLTHDEAVDVIRRCAEGVLVRQY